jgi:hypothetical protein
MTNGIIAIVSSQEAESQGEQGAWSRERVKGITIVRSQ